jgi:hypothetical protein
VRQDELDMGMTESSVQELNSASGRPKKRIDTLLRDAASSVSVDDGKSIICLQTPMALLLTILNDALS